MAEHVDWFEYELEMLDYALNIGAGCKDVVRRIVEDGGSDECDRELHDQLADHFAFLDGWLIEPARRRRERREGEA